MKDNRYTMSGRYASMFSEYVKMYSSCSGNSSRTPINRVTNPIPNISAYLNDLLRRRMSF